MKKSILMLFLVLCLSFMMMACEPEEELGKSPKNTDTQEEQVDATDPADTTDSSNTQEEQVDATDPADTTDSSNTNADTDAGNEKETTSGGIEVKDEDDDDEEWGEIHPLG